MTCQSGGHNPRTNRLTGYSCTQPVTHEVLVGCVHEHVEVNRHCTRHAGLLAEGKGICGECYYADGHRCPRILISAELLARTS